MKIKLSRSDQQDGSRGGVSAVGIQENGDTQAELGQQVLTGLSKEAIAFGHIAGADEDGGVSQVLGPPGKNGAMHKIADLPRFDAAVAENLIRTSIDGNDAVEHAGLRIAVQLNKDLAFVHSDSAGGGLIPARILGADCYL